MKTKDTDKKAIGKPELPEDEPSTALDEYLLTTLLEHAKGDLRLAEFKATDLRYWHTAQDCVNARIAIEKLIASRKG